MEVFTSKDILQCVGITHIVTLGAHAQQGYGFVCLSACLSLCLLLLQLACRTFIRPKHNTTYLAGHVDGHVCTNTSENSPLQS